MVERVKGHVTRSIIIVIVDYISNFWEVDRMNSTTTARVIKQLKSQFVRFGIPYVFVSYNGPQKSEEFWTFIAKWDVKAETAVKAAKLMVSKCKKSHTDPHLVLLDIRITSTQGLGTARHSVYWTGEPGHHC